MYHSYQNFRNGSQNSNMNSADTNPDTKSISSHLTAKLTDADSAKINQQEGNVSGTLGRVSGGPMNVPPALALPLPNVNQNIIPDHSNSQHANNHNFQHRPPHQVPGVQGNYYISQMTMPQSHTHTQPYVQSNQHILQRGNDFHASIPQFPQSRETSRIAEQSISQQNNSGFINQHSNNAAHQIQQKQYELQSHSHVHPHHNMQYSRSGSNTLQSSPESRQQLPQMGAQQSSNVQPTGVVSNIYQSPKKASSHSKDINYNSNKGITEMKDFSKGFEKDNYRENDSGASITRVESNDINPNMEVSEERQKKKRGRPKKLILDPSTNEYIDSSHPNFKELNKSLKNRTPTDQMRTTGYDTRMDLNSDGDLSKLLYQPTYMRTLKDKAVQELIQKKDRRGRPRKFPVEQTGLTIKGIRVNGTLKQRKKKNSDNFKISKNISPKSYERDLQASKDGTSI